MLKIRIKGRLGNQLFIYSFARKLSIKYNTNVLMYDRKKEDDKMWHSHLDNYHLSEHILFTSNKTDVMPHQPMSLAIYAYDRLKEKKLSSRKYHDFQVDNIPNNIKKKLFLLNDGYIELPSKIRDNTFFDGYFQSPKYFDDIRDTLLEEFEPKYDYVGAEKEFLDQIQQTESVCLTIRLGDYINNSTHQVCTRKFYEDAMDKMKELHPNCKFFVFSDEVEKAKEIFNFKYPVIYDSGTMPDFASLNVMSKCKHFIISNSSFSWWAQYLSRNNQKTVIAPERWYAKDVPCDIYQPSWLLMATK